MDVRLRTAVPDTVKSVTVVGSMLKELAAFLWLSLLMWDDRYSSIFDVRLGLVLESLRTYTQSLRS